MLDREIDCSYPVSKTEENGGDRPFHVRFYANEIADCIRPLKKRNGGQAKFRIGIYNPETNVFSKPTTWMRIYKRIGIAAMTFLLMKSWLQKSMPCARYALQLHE